LSLSRKLMRAIATLGQHAEQMLVGFTSSARGKKMTNFTVIDDVGQVRLLQRAVQAELRVQFQFALEHPVLVELKIPPAQGWRGNYYNPEGNLGRYTMLDLGGMKTHQILVRPGLEKTRFCAILAHEMTHAYQREQNILTENQALREGMARWVEYHLLQQDKSPEAHRLLKLENYTFGKAIESILSYEKHHGRAATLQWLNQHR
jgi:hypothetical protein